MKKKILLAYPLCGELISKTLESLEVKVLKFYSNDNDNSQTVLWI